jgi:hypothetical protein
MHDVPRLQGGQGLEELIEEDLDVGGGEGLGGDEEAGQVRLLVLQHQEQLFKRRGRGGRGQDVKQAHQVLLASVSPVLPFCSTSPQAAEEDYFSVDPEGVHRVKEDVADPLDGHAALQLQTGREGGRGG